MKIKALCLFFVLVICVVAETAVIPVLNFEGLAPLASWQVHGKGTVETVNLGEGHTLALQYDFREAIDTHAITETGRRTCARQTACGFGLKVTVRGRQSCGALFEMTQRKN